METELTEWESKIKELIRKNSELIEISGLQQKEDKLQQLEDLSQDPDVWNDHEKMKKINRDKRALERSVGAIKELTGRLNDCETLCDILHEEKDEKEFENLKIEVRALEKLMIDVELNSLLSGEHDGSTCYVSINSGAGGTEACDWAAMLCRMFTRYAEREDFKVEVISISEGEEAGFKSVTLFVDGPFAYGYLKSEAGVHRLVRVSPFDSNARRHTSFASVFVWPEVDGDIQVEIKPEDIRVDTYRASGAGGQHVNTTDSAVRITHIPTSTVVQCQNQRSQHANKDQALKLLKSALYEMEMRKQQEEKDKVNANKKANEWGSQIRSYVLHPYQMVKDHRTSHESGRVSNILDGEISSFIYSFLKLKAQEEGDDGSV